MTHAASVAPVYGLVLAGGASSRMRTDKAALAYHGRPQLHYTFDLAREVTERTFISVRRPQAQDEVRRDLPQIVDDVPAEGPIAGILTALQTHPQAAWLVLACDLPFIDRSTLEYLLAQRRPAAMATAYRSSSDGLPEPLCAVFEPHALEPLRNYVRTGRLCPRKFLLSSDTHLLDLPVARALDNVNDPEERAAALASLAH